MCKTEQIKDKIKYNMDEKGFEIWNLLLFHFSTITLFSLATGIKYSKYRDEAYIKAQKRIVRSLKPGLLKQKK